MKMITQADRINLLRKRNDNTAVSDHGVFPAGYNTAFSDPGVFPVRCNAASSVPGVLLPRCVPYGLQHLAGT